MSPVSAISTTQLKRSFGPVHAVDGISLEVPQGIVFGLLGPNGSGKTTMIRLLLGLLEADSGSASVLGFDCRTQADEIRLRSGALLEHTGLYERLTALENLQYFGNIWHMPRHELDQRIESLLTKIGLWDRRKESVGNWSRGMKQKLAVARALLHRPALVFLDEPTAGLDPVAAAALREDLAELAQREGVTIFLTTHNLAEAEKLCHSVAVIRKGKLLAQGSPHDLRSSQSGQLHIHGSGFTASLLQKLAEFPGVKQARQVNSGLQIELNQGHKPASLVTFLVQNGAEIDEVRQESADLEETFLSLVEETEETQG